MPRTHLFTLIALSCIVGCTRSNDLVGTTSASLAPPIEPLLAQAYVQGDNAMSVAGMWNFTLDPSTLEATLEPVQLRAGSQTDDTYALSLDQFFRPSQLRLASVRNSGPNVALAFEVTHPFPAPLDPTAPPNGFTNRADLGFSGILAVLGDVPSATGNTFFTDRVANTELMTNPHGYFSPEGLLPLSLIANTFPYRMVVHDADGGNRIGISNGNNPKGNFGANGWTRAELGADRTGWVGYNILHQGQSSSIEWELTRQYIATHSPLALQLAIIAKYNDPRGGTTPDEKLANRLPPATPDVAKFSYRMPHGTWDIPQVIVRQESGGFEVDSESSSTLRVSIEDWDLFSAETTETDLSLESDPRKVNVGEAGFPSIDVCIPGLLGDASAFQSFTPASDVVDDDSAYPDGDVGADTGIAGDPVYFEHLITKPAGTGQSAGPHRALFRARDLEDSAFGYTSLGPGLVVLTEDEPVPSTYQAFSVTLSDPPAGTGWAQLVGDENYSEALAVEMDPAGNVYLAGQFYGQTNFGGGNRIAVGGFDSFIVSYDPTGVYRWDRTWGTVDGDQINDLALLGPTQDTLVTVGGFTGTIDVGTGPLPSNGGYDILVTLIDAETGLSIYASAQGGTESESPNLVEVDSTSRIILGGYSQGNTQIFGTAFTTGAFEPWIVRGPATMDSTDMVQTVHSEGLTQLIAIAVDANDDVIATGTSTGSTTIDGTLYDLPPSSGNMWVDKLVADGHAEWVKLVRDLEGTGEVKPSAVAFTRQDMSAFIAGDVKKGKVNLGGGEHVVAPEDTNEPFVVQYTSEGNWVAENWYGESPYFEYIKNLKGMANGDVIACGGYENTIDLGGGVRPTHNPGGDTMFLFRTTGTGSFVWDALWDGGGRRPGFTEMATNDGGAIALIGTITDQLDANPGVNVAPLTPVAIRQSFVISLPGTPGW